MKPAEEVQIIQFQKLRKTIERKRMVNNYHNRRNKEFLKSMVDHITKEEYSEPYKKFIKKYKKRIFSLKTKEIIFSQQLFEDIDFCGKARHPWEIIKEFNDLTRTQNRIVKGKFMKGFKNFKSFKENFLKSQ